MRRLHGWTAENLATAYIKAVESGATGNELTQFFAPEVVLAILPSLPSSLPGITLLKFAFLLSLVP